MTLLLDLLLLIAAVVLFWKVRSLTRRVAFLERGLADLGAPQPSAPEPEQAGFQPEIRPLAESPAPAPVEPAEVVGPWQQTEVRPMLPPLPAAPSQVGPSAVDRRIASLGRWLVANWAYAVAAVSLILAGVFLVQYGVERGLLPPKARVLAALALGAALIAGGEAIRRRWGDSPDRSTAYLPSTFSGAGIVALFIGVFAARQLYGLIGPEAAFAGFLAVAALALVLGWFHGPFLAAVGLIGAGATPFLTGGGSGVPDWLPFYYALVAATGLGIDTMRRWAWVSVLALVTGFGGILFLAGFMADQVAPSLAATLIALLAMAIPARSLWPDQQGATVSEALWKQRSAGFPTLLAGGAVLVAVTLLTLWPQAGMAALACLSALVVALALWARGAPALSDLAALPALGFIARLVLESQGWPLWDQVRAQDITLRLPESPAPWTLSMIVALAVAGSLAAGMRSLAVRDYPKSWAALAALFAPVVLLVLELLWQPALVLGPALWAGHVIGIAAVMVALSERFAKADGGPAARTAYAVLAALSLIALALFVLLTKTALTLALAVLLVTAAALDRRMRLPEMGWFIHAAVAVIGWRLVVDPGLVWAHDAPLWEVVLAYGSIIAGTLAAVWLLRGLGHPGPKLSLESSGIGAAVLLGDVLIWRWVERWGDVPDHAAAALMALPWIAAMFAQLYRRAGTRGWFGMVRLALALAAGAIGVFLLLVAAIPLNPLIDGYVRGFALLSTLAVAYGLPGALLILGARRIAMPRFLSLVLQGVGGALATLWVALEIRHFWHGSHLTGPTLQAELYSYTLALLLTGAALLYLAITKGSEKLRRVAMGVIALTVAKVFLVDASGLTGLVRVASFLGLGLALAGLAWLNRWTAQKGAGKS